MLETLGEGSIHRMVFEEPEASHSSSFEIPELSEDDFKAIKHLQSNLDASRLKFVGDAKFLNIPIELHPRDVKMAKREISSYLLGGMEEVAVKFAAELKSAGGNPELSSGTITLIERKLDDSWKNDDLNALISFVKNFKKLQPNFVMSEGHKSELLSDILDLLDDARQALDWDFYASTARECLEIGLEVAVTADDIEQMSQECDRLFRKNWPAFLSLAADLKYITDYYSKRKTVSLATPSSIPEERKF